MKRDWLLYLVIFSLALNVGTIGTFAYLRWQDQKAASVAPAAGRLPFRELVGKLQLDEEQRQVLGRLAPEHWRQVREYRRELVRCRQELFGLLKQERLPEWGEIQAKVREISTLQLRLEEEMVRHLLEVQKHLRPEQRQRLLSHLEQHLGPFWGPRGPHGGGRPHLWSEGRGPGLTSPDVAPKGR